MLPKIESYFKRDSDKNKIKVYPEFDYKINFDGCSKGNPGLAGAGAVIYHHGNEIWSGDIFVGEKSTNNQAEYIGLIFGLQNARALNIRNIKVEGDSLLVINQMNGIYKCKSDKLFEHYKKAKEIEEFFDVIEYHHIFRNKNKRADELSNIAIEKYLMREAF